MRGDRALARSRWQALKDLHPPPQIEQMLDARIAELGLRVPASRAAGERAPSGRVRSPRDEHVGGGPRSRSHCQYTIAPALKSRLKPEAPLFVFAREPGSQGRRWPPNA